MFAKILLALVMALFSVLADAQEKLVHVERKDISKQKLVTNFAITYGLQWTFYLAQQHQAIKSDGSFENMGRNFFSPHFDRDNLETNIIQHGLAGATYYLYYRSRGYSEAQAFVWTNVSALAFEFAIETYTERPSYQDLALTPTLGTAIGFVGERLSLHFHNKRVFPGRVLGFLFNPYSVLPSSSYEWKVIPIVGAGQVGAKLEWRF